MTAQIRQLAPLCLSLLPIIATIGCKKNSTTPKATDNPKETMKAKVDTLLIGEAFQACVAKAPLQISFYRLNDLPKNIIGNISPTNANFEFVQIEFPQDKGPQELFLDNQKLFMVNKDGKRVACPFSKVYIGRDDWGPVATKPPPAPALAPNAEKPTESGKSDSDLVSVPGEMLAMIGTTTFLKQTTVGSEQLTDAEKCHVVVDEKTKMLPLHAFILPSERPEHFLIQLASDVAGGKHALCKKGAKVYVYARHLKGHSIAIKTLGKTQFKKQTASTTEVCEFHGQLIAQLIDYSFYNNQSYFKVELIGSLPNVSKEQNFCQKGSVGYIAIGQFAVGAKP